MLGPVYFRSFTHLSAKPALHLKKTQPNSFVKTILPVTHTRSTACAQNLRISMKIRIYGGGGGGVPPIPRYSHSGKRQEQSATLYNTAVSCSTSPLAKRAGLSASMLLTTSMCEAWLTRLE